MHLPQHLNWGPSPSLAGTPSSSDGFKTHLICWLTSTKCPVRNPDHKILKIEPISSYRYNSRESFSIFPLPTLESHLTLSSLSLNMLWAHWPSLSFSMCSPNSGPFGIVCSSTVFSPGCCFPSSRLQLKNLRYINISKAFSDQPLWSMTLLLILFHHLPYSYFIVLTTILYMYVVLFYLPHWTINSWGWSSCPF